MYEIYEAASIESDMYTKSFNVNIINNCPICKKSIKPDHLNSVYFEHFNDDKMITEAVLDSHLLCPGCNSSFIVRYLFINRSYDGSYFDGTLIYIAPNKAEQFNFNPEIESLSQQFVKIYNQALAAESYSLDEIAGLGFRKSLEFLIKDFAISENPDKTDTIKSMNLSACIKEYISDSIIKTLATKSAWIGNDEAHYVRKHEDRDLSDLKRFIHAAVHFISMFLIAKDAGSIEPK